MSTRIKNIIFDFGDIFINLDKEAPLRGILELDPGFVMDEETDHINKAYETGSLATPEFVAHYRKKIPHAREEELITVWNSIILDLPVARVRFLEDLKKTQEYRLFLLSNTNALHMLQVEMNTGKELLHNFRAQFEQFYLSHEIGLRKPNADIYEFVLDENSLDPKETLFVDDLRENTDAAARLELHTWNLQPGVEDITELFTKNLPL